MQFPHAWRRVSRTVAFLTVKQRPLALQGSATFPRLPVPPGTDGCSGPAYLVRFHHWRGRHTLSSRKVPPGPLPPSLLTCSCGTGGLRVYQPRKARACNLREEGGRRINLGERRHFANARSGQGKGRTKLSLLFLTQIKNRKLWQRRHDPPAKPNSAPRATQLFGGQVGCGRATENRRRSGN